MVMLVTVAGILAFRNDAVGFLAGMAWHLGFYAVDHWREWSGGREAWFKVHRRQTSQEPLLGAGNT
jgi:hypothetical protein